MAESNSFLEFVGDMYRHWVGKMTATLSVLIALSPLVFPSFFGGDKGLLKTQWTWWAVSAISFLIASRMAWGEQHKKRKIIESENLELEKKLSDRAPRFALSAVPLEGQQWNDLGQDSLITVFYVQHFRGDAATHVSVGPITSLNGENQLVFDSIDVVSGQVRITLQYCLYVNGQRVENGGRIRSLLYFLPAHTDHEPAVIRYDVPVEWEWDGTTIKEVQELQFDTARKRFSFHPKEQRT